MLKRSFIQAKKVRLAPTGKYNTQEGLIHYKRKRETDDDDGYDGGASSSQRPCLNASFDSQFND